MARDALHAFKFHGKRALARPLAGLLLEQWGPGLAAAGIEALVPVPLGRTRERERGFNQAELLARRDGQVLFETAKGERRRADVGPNKLVEAKKEPGWHAFLRQYRDLMQSRRLGA